MASTFKSEVTVIRNSAVANGKSVMSLLILAAPRGSQIDIETSGDDADAALAALGQLVEQGFGE